MQINSISLLLDWEQDREKDLSWNGRVKFQDGWLEKVRSVTRPLSPFFGWGLRTRLTSRKIVWNEAIPRPKQAVVWTSKPSMLTSEPYVEVWAFPSKSEPEFMSMSGLSDVDVWKSYVDVWMTLRFNTNGLPYAQTSPSYVTSVRCQLSNGTNYWTLEYWKISCKYRVVYMNIHVVSAQHLTSGRCTAHSARQFVLYNEFLMAYASYFAKELHWLELLFV